MNFLFLKLLLALFFVSVQVNAEAQLHLLYTSDVHGVIQPCKRCPSNTLGGYSARGYIVDSLRIIHSNSLVVVSGGDFSAGSPYDPASEGVRELDSIRTILSLRAMNRIGYDAIGLGDNDLRWGIDFLRRKIDSYGLPFVSLSYRDSQGALIGKPFIETEKGGKKIIITSVGVRPSDEILALGYAYQPISLSMEEFFGRVDENRYDAIFIINHAGEDSLSVIEQQLTQRGVSSRTVILNGHKKFTPAYLFYTKKDSIPVVNFDHAASRISYATIATYAETLKVGVKPIDVLRSVGENSQIKRIVEEFNNITRNFLVARHTAIRVELFIDTEYENTGAVLRDVMPFLVQNSEAISLTIHYLDKKPVDFKKTGSTSLGDMDDFAFQAALQIVDRDRFFAYLAFRHLHNRTDRYSFLENVEIDTVDVRKVLESAEFKSFFETNKNLIEKFNLEEYRYAILMNGQKLDNFETVYDIQFKICSFYPAAFCAELPECQNNTHCANRGLTGVCSENRCSYVRDPFFTFNVVSTDRSFNEPDTDFIRVIEDLFPSSHIRYKNADSPDVKAMIERKNVRKLPFYYADEAFKECENFKFFETSFVDAGDYLFFDANHYIPYFKLDSTPIFGNAEVYININSSIVKDDPKLVNAVVDLYSTGRIEKIHFIMPSSNLYSYEIEEVHRAQFIHDNYPREVFGAYLRDRIRNIESSYWNRSLDAAGIRYRRFSRDFQNFSYSPKQLNSLLKSNPIFMLINNNEYVIIRSFDDLFKVMRFIDDSHGEYKNFNKTLLKGVD